MALILGYHVGETIYFGHVPVKVIASTGHSHARLLIDGESFDISDLKATEIMKGVYVSCGVPKIAREGGAALPRLVIEAPRSLVILREELYGKPRPPKSTTLPHPSQPCLAGKG
jgi:sRNA-binding carbon storage regulator CsrA